MSSDGDVLPEVLLNLAGLRVAGGRSVAVNLLRAWSEAPGAGRLSVVGPSGAGYEAELPDGARWIPLEAWRARGWARPWIDTVTLPRAIAKVEPDVVLTLSNFACRLPAGSTALQAVQVMWPYAMYDEPEIWRRVPPRNRPGKRLRRRYLRRAARRADVLIAQTPAARDRLMRFLPAMRAVVIPTAVSLPATEATSEPRILLGEGPAWICVSRYYPHKNLEILVDVAEVLKSRGRASRIILTIERGQDPETAALMKAVEERGLSSHLHTVGELELDAVRGLYRSAFGVVFPTLLESYSQVFVEALGYGLPLVTSDRDFARSVCGDAPVYVDPLDAVDIAEAMIHLEEDDAYRQERIEAALAWADAQPTWHETGRTYAALCRSLATAGDTGHHTA